MAGEDFYKGKVDVEKDGVLRPCGRVIKCKNFVKQPLMEHLKTQHKSVCDRPAGQPSILAHALKESDVAERQKDNIVMAFAESGLPFRVIEKEKFRKTFGPCLPPGFNRHELSRATVQLRERCETKLWETLRGQDVFLEA